MVVIDNKFNAITVWSALSWNESPVLSDYRWIWIIPYPCYAVASSSAIYWRDGRFRSWRRPPRRWSRRPPDSRRRTAGCPDDPESCRPTVALRSIATDPSMPLALSEKRYIPSRPPRSGRTGSVDWWSTIKCTTRDYGGSRRHLEQNNAPDRKCDYQSRRKFPPAKCWNCSFQLIAIPSALHKRQIYGLPIKFSSVRPNVDFSHPFEEVNFIL